MTDEARATLANMNLLRGLTADELDELRLAMRPFGRAAGAHLCRQGEEPGDAFFLAGGRVRISVKLPGEEEMKLRVVTAGDVVGELALLDGAPRSASAVAEEDVEGYVLPRHAFALMLGALRPVAFKLVRRVSKGLAARVRALLAQVAAAASEDGGGGSEQEAVAAVEGERVPVVDVDYLCSLPALAKFTRTDLERLLAEGRGHEMGRRATVVQEGEARASCFLVVTGAVQPFVTGRRGKVKLPLLGPAGIVGASPVLDGAAQDATCVARERSVLVELERDVLERWLDDDDPLGFKLLELLVTALLAQTRNTTRRYAWLQAEQRWRRRRAGEQPDPSEDAAMALGAFVSP